MMGTDAAPLSSRQLIPVVSNMMLGNKVLLSILLRPAALDLPAMLLLGLGAAEVCYRLFRRLVCRLGFRLAGAPRR
jgi:hypothetical protein